MKWLWLVPAVLAALVAAVALVGALLPRDHAASRRARFRQPAAALWAAITDVAAMPQWRTGMKSAEWLPDRDGRRCYREVTSFGPMEFAIEQQVAEQRLVLRIVTPGSPFGGTWTFRIDGDRDGRSAVLQITEDGEIYNVFFRALARFVFGYTATMDGYLLALGRKFGETVAIEAAEPERAAR